MRKILIIIILTHIFILSRLIYFPYPELFIYPYLANNGLLPYKQIFDQHFPGLMFFPVNLGTLGMNDAYSARLVSYALVVITQLLLFLVANYVFRSKTKALFANFLYLVWQPFFEGWVLWIDSFLPPILLSSFLFYKKALESKKHLDFILAGVFLGIGLVFKQVVLPLIIICGIFLYFKAREKSHLVWFIAGVIPLPLLMFSYFWTIGTFTDFWYWTVTFNLTTFAEYGKKLPTLSGLLRVGFVFGMSIFALFYKKKRFAIPLIVYLFGSLAVAVTRFDFVHLQPALPFVVLASVISFEAFYKRFNGGKLMILGYMVISLILLVKFYEGHLGEKVFFFDDQTLATAEKIRQITEPKEHIFIYGAIPHLYQLSGTLPAGGVFVHHFSWFLKVSEDRILEGLEIDRPKLVVADRSINIEGKNLTDYSRKINSYISENYITYDTIGSNEFMRRKD